MALLLGSDYTEGVPGIGIVNAVEVRRWLLWMMLLLLSSVVLRYTETVVPCRRPVLTLKA